MLSVRLRRPCLAASLWTISSLSLACYQQHEVAAPNLQPKKARAEAAGAMANETQLESPLDRPLEANSVNNDQCPTLTASIVGPTQIQLGDSAEYTAHAESDPPRSWTFEWSVGDGTLSSLSGAHTFYTCTAPGNHALALTAVESASCRTAMAMPIACRGLE
jgi:hypothetical protein